MFSGFYQLQRLIGITSAPSQEEVAKIVENAVNTFLDGYGLPHSQNS